MADPRVLTVSGDLPKPTTTLDVKALEALGPVTETVHGKHVTGVSLQKVLESLGHGAGPTGKTVDTAAKHAGHRKVVIAHARDGYEAVFSTAELDVAVGPTVALVVWAVDGKPVADGDGPFTLAVLSDTSGVRSIRQLDRLDVRAVSTR